MVTENINKKQGRIATSVSFNPDVFERLERLKGRMSRSTYINIALDEVMTHEEKRLGIA